MPSNSAQNTHAKMREPPSCQGDSQFSCAECCCGSLATGDEGAAARIASGEVTTVLAVEEANDKAAEDSIAKADEPKEEDATEPKEDADEPKDNTDESKDNADEPKGNAEPKEDTEPEEDETAKDMGARNKADNSFITFLQHSLSVAAPRHNES